MSCLEPSDSIGEKEEAFGLEAWWEDNILCRWCLALMEGKLHSHHGGGGERIGGFIFLMGQR